MSTTSFLSGVSAGIAIGFLAACENPISEHFKEPPKQIECTLVLPGDPLPWPNPPATDTGMVCGEAL